MKGGDAMTERTLPLLYDLDDLIYGNQQLVASER